MKSTHFGACLGLARDRLIRLGWATSASPNQFLRFLFFSHSLFCFRRTATAQLFRLLYCKEHGFSLNGKRS